MSCFTCQDIERVEEGSQPWAVARLTTGYVWMNSMQYFEGLTFFVSRWCVDELFELEREKRVAHLYEMTEVAAAVRDAFGATKMNYEALGNSVPHLHWWLTPRRPSDPRPRAPIWEDLDFLHAEWTKGPAAPESRRQALRSSLLTTLATRDVTIERAFL